MTPLLSPGKIRSLQAASSPEGAFTILAIDHRDALRAVIRPDDMQAVTAEQLSTFKLDTVRALGSLASAILLDPVYSLAQAIVGGALPGHVAVISALEEQGYLGDPLSRETTLLDGWSVEKIKRLGANGVKILLFYHPESPAAERQDALVQQIVADCAHADLPLYLEPILYSPDRKISKDAAEFAQERPRLTIESVKRLGALGPDILKVEFPVDARHQTDETLWRESCEALNQVCPVPWVLLSAGASFEVYCQQLEIACQAGCSGFMAGRAVWNEGATLGGDARMEFLNGLARARFEKLLEIARRYAHPWQARVSFPAVDEEWYRHYLA